MEAAETIDYIIFVEMSRLHFVPLDMTGSGGEKQFRSNTRHVDRRADPRRLTAETSPRSEANGSIPPSIEEMSRLATP